jgi:hypothetical protein
MRAGCQTRTQVTLPPLRVHHNVLACLLERRFGYCPVNPVWDADVAYVVANEAWLYLAAVMDPDSRISLAGR